VMVGRVLLGGLRFYRVNQSQSPTITGFILVP